MLSNGLYPTCAAQGHHIHTDTSFWKVCVEKLATQSVAVSRMPQQRCGAHLKLVEHDKMCWQVGRLHIAAEVICRQPRLRTVVEHVSFIRVVADAAEVRLARQKFHRYITVDIATQNIHLTLLTTTKNNMLKSKSSSKCRCDMLTL